MHTRDRVLLFTKVRFSSGEGAVIKENEGDGQTMLVGESEEFTHSLLEPIGIVLPHDILQENTQAVVASLLRPAQFLIYGLGVKGFRLPHLCVIDRSARQVIAPANRPEALVPRPGFLRAPRCLNCLRRFLSGGGWQRNEECQ